MPFQMGVILLLGVSFLKALGGIELRKFTVSVCLLAVVWLGVSFSPILALDGPVAIPDVPVKGMVTMLDMGADRCVPCKMMAPILRELETEYQGKAAILFIDVWKNPEQGKSFRIRAIPTQIFYDKDGREVLRHEGFMDKQSIVAVLERLGVTK
jgi:thioredoxin 1